VRRTPTSSTPDPAATGAAGALADLVIEAVPDPLLVFDAELRCLSGNRAFQELFFAGAVQGRPIPDVLGSRWSESPLGDAIEALVARQRAFDGLEATVAVPRSGEHTLVCHGHPVGAGVYLLAMKDVTERLVAEELQQIVDTAPDAILFVDREGRIERVNVRAEALFGHPREHMVGQPIEMLIPERFRSRHVTHRSVFRHAPSVRPMGSGLALYARRKDGSEFPVDVNLSVVALKGRTLTAAAVRDITAHEEAERELARAKEDADLANLTKSRFLAAAGHDLRQPLQSLSMYLGILGRAPEQLTTGRIGEKMARSIEAMGDLLDALLDISKLDAGAVEPHPRDVPVQDVVDRAVANLEPQAGARALRLDMVRCSVRVHTDPILLERIVTNFLANAIRYTDAGRVLVGCRRRGAGVQVQVWDTGIGIPAESLDHIFEEYVQLQVPGPERGKGLGLGLAVVRRLSTLLEHRLEVRSRLGQGSMFAVTLPGARAGRADACAVEPVAALVSGAGVSVLLVDDDASILDATSLLLETYGFDVRTASGVEEALAQARRRPPDAVVADYRLPAGNGFDVIRRIRALSGTHVPAVVMTGDTSTRDERIILPEGCALIHKPVDVEELLQALAHVRAKPARS
jgi:PAS domain S-box-containing protein